MNLPGYPFAELEAKARAIKLSGKPLYDLSIGDPDLPAPSFLQDAVKEALNLPHSHKYPSSQGDINIRKTVCNWFYNRFGVKLDPESQVCLLIGAKEGLSHLALGVVDPGDVVAAPEPSYPVYARAGCQLAGGKLRILKLEAKNGFLPDLNEVVGSKLLYLNYPNNPTGAMATDKFLNDLADLASRESSPVIAYDMAYSELSFDKPARSILEFTPNAIEFHSLSKMANATGFRIGFAVGNPNFISVLTKVKQEYDSGAPLVFQYALKEVLKRYNGLKPHPEMIESFEIYRNRKERLSAALESHGLDVFPSKSTFYVWFKVGEDEIPFITKALDQGILLTPGRGFGDSCRGWVRASITASDETVEKVIQKLKKL